MDREIDRACDFLSQKIEAAVVVKIEKSRPCISNTSVVAMSSENDDFCICKTESRVLNRNNPWIRYRIVSEFAGFPNDIAGVIADYLSIMKLCDWINKSNLEMCHLVVNPNVLLTEMIPDLDDTSTNICANPLAFDHVKKDPEKYLSLTSKWFSPPLTEWLLSFGFYPNAKTYYHIGFCESKIAIQWLLDNVPKSEAIAHLSGNPLAIDVLRQNLDLVDEDQIWCNYAAVDILQDKIAAGKNICWKWISRNRSQWAMDLLQVNQDKINWPWFAENPAIFEVADHPEKDRLMKILSRT